jgi:UDP-N-acetylmuramoyl-L-alanyl-D-glutamate--2,6-diaminopimelate ligase
MAMVMSPLIHKTTPPAWFDVVVHAPGVTTDSRTVAPGWVFLAYPGTVRDGRQFIREAASRGAGLVLWEADGFIFPTDVKVPNESVVRLRERASEIAGDCYGHPSRGLYMVGVTGTNGKTSTAHWVAQALAPTRGPAAVLGTLGNGLLGQLEDSANTTLDAALLQKTLADYARAGAKCAAMEVSSHALDQARVSSVKYDVAVFTNLSRDHLDYHGSMDAYGAAKAKLFRMPTVEWSIINADDAFGQRLLLEARSDRSRVLTYGIDHGELKARNITQTLAGTAFDLDTPCGMAHVALPVLGRFNVYNLLAVFGVLLASGMSVAAAAARLCTMQPVRGRMQLLNAGRDEPLVVVDYAHTPDALDKALVALKPSVPAGGKLICVFGCGGDRDPGKRPHMGAVSARLADYTVVTSDNPRGESPEAIVAAVAEGVGGATHATVVDRREAIAHAIGGATAKDIVLIAGKGHETYQDIAGVRHPFDDVAVALTLLNGGCA